MIGDLSIGKLGVVWTIYIVIISYFILGVISFYFITRKQKPPEARRTWIKFFFYFLIIQVLFFSIVINPVAFRILAILIILAGFYELFKLFRESGFILKKVYWASLLFYGIFSTGFFFFSRMEKELVLFTFMILSIFDSFSQITGQSVGRRLIASRISPHKTLEGLIGGTLASVMSAILFRSVIGASPAKSMGLAAVISLFAFIGDMSASFYKRQYRVKDYSNLIPGHGGFLDRFDSLITGGALMAFLDLLINL